MRIAKFISNSGYCSRRKAEDIILAGRVKLNDAVISNLATQIAENDIVTLDGKKLSHVKPRMWLYHKPTGLVTTHSDPQGRPTVFNALPKSLPRVISIGRLDINSEGLLVLTNLGAIARYFELPKNNFSRVYRARVYGNIDVRLLAGKRYIIDGVGEKLSFEYIKYSSGKGQNIWYEIALKEGKNREVRRIFEALGGEVNRLIRVEYGPFELGDLPLGALEEVAQELVDEIMSKITND